MSRPARVLQNIYKSEAQIRMKIIYIYQLKICENRRLMN